MSAVSLAKDPYNIIITGVGGQGNVLASRLLGGMLAGKGYLVTIGETFGASQRGGSVMSHLRISGKSVASPQIPMGRADVIVSLEPAEAVRVMAAYGNPDTILLTNTHPIYPVGVIKGELDYPPVDEMKDAVKGILRSACFIDATDPCQHCHTRSPRPSGRCPLRPGRLQRGHCPAFGARSGGDQSPGLRRGLWDGSGLSRAV